MRILFAYNNPMALPIAEWLTGQGDDVILISEPITAQTVREFRLDLILSYCYKHLFSKEIIDEAGGNIVNLHTSYLPWNRGSDPNFWSFWEDTPKGVTIHYIDEKLDRGRIIAQRQVALDPSAESFSSSYEKLHEEMRRLFIEMWPRYADWRANSYAAEGAGSYHSSRDLVNLLGGDIKWSENIESFIAMYKNARGGVMRYKFADFVSSRLYFRGIRKEDSADIVRWRSDPEIYRYFFNPRPVSLESHLQWFDKYIDDETRVDFIIKDRVGEKNIGVVGLQNLSDETVDVAYMIGEKSERRKGFGAEAVKTMTRFAFENLPIKTIRSVVLNENAASRKLMEKVGYSCVHQVYIMQKDEFNHKGG